MTVPPSSAAAPLHPARWFVAGVRGSACVPGMVLFATYLGFGGLLHDLGFPPIAGVLSVGLMWALPAQVILIGGLAAGTALPALALAVCLSGVRLLPMVVTLLPLLRGPRPHVLREMACAHFVAVTMWVEGLRQLPAIPIGGRPAYAAGLGSGLIAMSSAGVVLGYHLAGVLPGPLAVALLLLTPISFTILLVRGARQAVDWLALGLGFVLAPLTANVAGGLDLFWSGVGGGTLAFFLARLGKDWA